MGTAGKPEATRAGQAEGNLSSGSNHERLSTLQMPPTFLNQARARLAITSVSH